MESVTRSHDAAGAIAALLSRLDALAEGESLRLHGEDDAQDIVRILQLQRANLFDWTLEQRQGAGFDLEIRRRAEGARVDLGGALRAEHRLLDGLVGTLELRVSQGLIPLARCTYDELMLELERHLDFEERVVFPTYERLAEGGEAITALLRPEKAALRRMLTEVGALLPSGDRLQVLSDLADMREVMGPHFRTEEEEILPVLGRALAGERVDARS